MAKPRTHSLLAGFSRSSRARAWAFLLVLSVLAHGKFATIVLAAQMAPGSTVTAPPRQRLSLDHGWLFHEGDIPFPVVTGHQASYSNAKAGTASGAAAPEFDDSLWKKVDIPHDWAVEQPFDPMANSAQGYRQRGIGWYRRYFNLDPTDHGKHLELELDGVATHCTLWVNGVLAARNWSGYNSIYVDITPYARYGNRLNVIAVRVDANAMEGWWYEGAGIYRHTWLVKRNPVHIATDGVYANPVRDGKGYWSIPVQTELENSGSSATTLSVQSILLDANGKTIALAESGAALSPLTRTTVSYTLAAPSPRLWSLKDPYLYTVRTLVKHGDTLLDDVNTTAGFRTLRFDPDRGFFLNDEPVKLLGTANHQDSAGVGVAVPDSLWAFRIRRLKEMGSNTYRSAHNAPAAEFLDAADHLGMLVMDENRNFGASPELMEQLQWEIRRDRNHPSVIMWSVFNEEPSQGTEMGYELVRRMSEKVKELDKTRPVTTAQSGSTLNPINAEKAADLAGFNYQPGDYDAFHATNPDKPMFSSEDTSSVMTRDVFEKNRSLDVLDSYDDQVMPWGLSHRDAWKQIDSRPFVAGTMVWAGFDYRGETQPLAWPAAGSSFGIMDLCGFPKSAYWIHQAQWIKDRPVLHLIPHWNWPGKEGVPIKVMVLSNADSVVLTLNGKQVAAGPIDRYQMATFMVTYQPGKLEAIATTGTKEIARYSVETTGRPARIALLPDRATLAGDGSDAQPVTVEVTDAQGRVVPEADADIRFEISGPGHILGLNNGDPTNHQPEHGSEHQVYNGLAQAILQSHAGAGLLTLHATSPGLAAAELNLEVEPTKTLPEVPVVDSPPLEIRNWRRSPFTRERPDPNEPLLATDMNSWQAAQPGDPLPSAMAGTYVVYRAQFPVRAATQANGGRILLRAVAGKAHVYLDGELVGQKDKASSGDLSVPCKPGGLVRTISVLMEAAHPLATTGLGGIVTVQ